MNDKGIDKMNKAKIRLSVSVLLFIICTLAGCGLSDHIPTETVSPVPSIGTGDTVEPTEIPLPDNSTFTVHYIDVGQADAALVLCDGKKLLIDGGNVADSSLIVAYLKKLNIDYLDYIVCTHAHEDHVGGLSGALAVVSAGVVYAPETPAESDAYNNFVHKAAERDLQITHPEIGNSISLGNSTIQFLGPITENTSEKNNTSIVLKITYGDTSFLFTGDAEREEEQDIINAGYDLSADVLKVGHHGSDSSTSYVFLREVMPQYAVISVGAGNSYGHPTEEVLSRLRDADVELYRTDLQGDIIAESNGSVISITTERNEDIRTNETQIEVTEGEYIGNKNSKKFHKPTCNTLPIEKNRVYFNSRSEAVENGFTPCGNCLP